MSAPTKLFLDMNSMDHQWKVLDKDGFCYGTGETPEFAIKSARIVTNAPIYANSDFKGNQYLMSNMLMIYLKMLPCMVVRNSLKQWLS